MARRVFVGFEAVAAMVPTEGGYHAAIAVKKLGAVDAPIFHKVLDGQVFKTAMSADEAATIELERLQSVNAHAELVW